jgi:imidazoleglycerol-phosphate dehydratase
MGTSGFAQGQRPQDYNTGVSRLELIETRLNLARETKLMRQAIINRTTNETQISASVNLDGSGKCEISTGVGFFDHMLDQLGRHGLIDLAISAKGDLHIDGHHTVEDTGIALGQAVHKGLGERRGIVRYGNSYLPMDETLTRASIDVSGRPFLVFRTDFHSAKIGQFDTQLVREFFQAFAMNAGITLHVETLYGVNDHHIAESCFKAVARALRAAITIDPRQSDAIPSTKGVL